MFCPKCGGENADTYKFCRICGTPLTGKKAAEGTAPKPEAEAAKRVKPEDQRTAGAKEAPVYTSQPGFAGGAPADQTASMPVRTVKAVRSPLTLLTILLFTASIVLVLMSLFQGGAQLDIIASELSGTVANVSGSALVVGIVSQIPNILICIGMWLVYISALKNKPGEISTTGITIIKVLVIIAFVIFCIAAAIGVIGMLGLGSGSFALFSNVPELDLDMERAVGAATIVVVVILAIILVLVILFFVKVLSTLKWTKAQLRNEESKKSPSMYVAVLLFIAAVLSLISIAAAAGMASLLSSAVMAEGYGELLSALAPALSGNVIISLVDAVYLLLAGIIIIRLRGIRNS